MVFPGQGSQAVGMLADLANEYPVVTETFKQSIMKRLAMIMELGSTRASRRIK